MEGEGRVINIRQNYKALMIWLVYGETEWDYFGSWEDHFTFLNNWEETLSSIWKNVEHSVMCVCMNVWMYVKA